MVFEIFYRAPSKGLKVSQNRVRVEKITSQRVWVIWKAS
jgi:hypothetical protein